MPFQKGHQAYPKYSNIIKEKFKNESLNLNKVELGDYCFDFLCGVNVYQLRKIYRFMKYLDYKISKEKKERDEKSKI